MDLDSQTTALVLIDLQNLTAGATLAPHSAADVIARGASLATAMRSKGSPIVYVRVDPAEFVLTQVDLPGLKAGMTFPPEAAELSPDCGYQAGDLVVVKRSWGAFHGTHLDQALRRRNVRTIVLGGISTNQGVESTARAACDHGYDVVLVEDAMGSSLGADAHRFAVETIFPRIGRVRTVKDILQAVTAGARVPQ